METATLGAQMDTVLMLPGLNASHVRVKIAPLVLLILILNVLSVMMGGTDITSNACKSALKDISKTTKIIDVIHVWNTAIAVKIQLHAQNAPMLNFRFQTVGMYVLLQDNIQMNWGSVRIVIQAASLVQAHWFLIV